MGKTAFPHLGHCVSLSCAGCDKSDSLALARPFVDGAAGKRANFSLPPQPSTVLRTDLSKRALRVLELTRALLNRTLLPLLVPLWTVRRANEPISHCHLSHRLCFAQTCQRGRSASLSCAGCVFASGVESRGGGGRRGFQRRHGGAGGDRRWIRICPRGPWP